MAPIIEDLDPERSSSVTFVLREFASGTVVGSIDGIDDSAMVSVSVSSEEGSSWRSAHGEMSDDGSYRVEKAPAGHARVTAMEYGYRARRSRVESVVVPENGEIRVDFDFAAGAELRGRVTRHGEPVPGALVNVSSSVYGDADSMSDTDGYYTCRVPNGRFELSVSTVEGTRREYEVDVEGPTTFDVELGGAALIGRVIDGETGRPVAGAEVRVERQSDGAGSLGSDDLTTDSSGSFRFDDLPVGRHVVRVAHPSYVQQRRAVDLGSDSVGEIEVVLEKAEGMRVYLVDARTGAPLSGTVVARNMGNEVVFDGNPRKDGDGVRLLLPPGTYKVSASANGHATHTEIADAPSDEVVIRLTRGGTLIVRATEPAPRDAKLVMPSGEEYIRCWCNRVAEIRLEGTITGIENVAAGSYDLAVTERDGTVSRYPVTVIEDQAVEVLID